MIHFDYPVDSNHVLSQILHALIYLSLIVLVRSIDGTFYTD
jgi:hypothetical protein